MSDDSHLWNYRPPPQQPRLGGGRRVWTLVSGTREATATLRPHPLGVELVVEDDGVLRRSQVHADEEKALGDAGATRERLEALGWRPVSED